MSKKFESLNRFIKLTDADSRKILGGTEPEKTKRDIYSTTSIPYQTPSGGGTTDTQYMYQDDHYVFPD